MNPVKVYWSWKALKPLVERAGGFGALIFVGLFSERERKEAIQAMLLP